MHVRAIKETVELLRRDQAFRQAVATDPEAALDGLGLARDEREAIATLSRRPDWSELLERPMWW